MKKTLLLLMFFQFSFSQNLTETEKLSSLCKVWGFLKYYHPEFASGKKDCDIQFFKILIQVKESQTQEDLSNVYSNWIDELGKVKETDKKDNSVYFTKNFDLSWFENFSPALTSKLKYIEKNRFRGKHNYVSIGKYGALNFINEKNKKDLDANEDDLKLLSLFRYWNMVEYFHPYKYLMDQKWDSVLEESIASYQNSTGKNEYELLIKQLVSKLDDSHAVVITNDNIRKLFPFSVNQIEGKAVVVRINSDSLAKKLDIRLGDIILEINGIPMTDKLVENSKYVSGSNEAIKQLGTHNYTLYETVNDTNVLKIERNKKIEERKVVRYLRKDIFQTKTNNKPWKLVNDKIAYIDLGDLKQNQVNEMLDAVSKKSTLIFDLRSYPEYHTYLFSKLFGTRETFCQIIKPTLKYPGKFTIEESKMGVKNKAKYNGKIIVLVNEFTGSRAEFMTMIFQAYKNVTVIGSQTAGTNGDIASFKFLEGYYTSFSGLGIFYPDGSEMQRKGVKIDIPVKQTLDSLLNGKDEILEEAIRYSNL